MIRKFLLVDDDTDDAELFCEAVGKIRMAECNTVENGLELFKLLSIRTANIPDVIFLDINMPMMDGWECLKELKKSSNYSRIPIIMYSTSSAKQDIDRAYSLGAQLFLTKPEDFSELSKILETVAVSSQDSLTSRLKGFKSVKLN